MSVVNDHGDPPLWLALDNSLEDIASTLVSKNTHSRLHGARGSPPRFKAPARSARHRSDTAAT